MLTARLPTLLYHPCRPSCEEETRRAQWHLERLHGDEVVHEAVAYEERLLEPGASAAKLREPAVEKSNTAPGAGVKLG